MKNAILVHGTPDKEEYFSDKYPSSSNSHWFPWLQKELLIKGIATQTPEIPDAYEPSYEKYKREFERYEVNEDSILVGHSFGAGFLIRWLSENKVKVKKLVLVAPYWEDDFEIDSGLGDRVGEIHILVSSDDDVVTNVKEFAGKISQILPSAKMHKFSDKGHFCFDDMGTEKFPELLDFVIE